MNMWHCDGVQEGEDIIDVSVVPEAAVLLRDVPNAVAIWMGFLFSFNMDLGTPMKLFRRWL